jgi:DNA mismatch repair protein MutS2
MVTLVMRHDWIPPRIPDALPGLRRLSVEGSVLDEADLLALAELLSASRRVRSDLRRDPGALPGLTQLSEALVAEPGLEERVLGSFGVSGQLADGASGELRRVRGELRGSRSRLVKRLEVFVATLPARIQVSDASVTIRSGRYCIPIRREGASQVGGIVHDESATHQTIFVEPPLAIEGMNRIFELEREEAREVHRILAELSDRIRPLADDLRIAFDTLGEADSLQARARYGLAHGGSRPELVESEHEKGLELIDAVHPLLLAAGEPAVPFTLRLALDERVLLISGPNAGGKTVTLKAIGLLAALAQSGVIPPVGPQTRLPVFDGFFAVIGDEQSISASLSTFSAQVVGLGEILDRAGPASLVLLDEIGGSTDPAEGAALAGAILLRLSTTTRLTVATTHLGALKQLAAETPSVVNASLQFDVESMSPSFLLVRDRPGRSYALEIASRLGLPAELVDAARGRLGNAERQMDQVLRELQSAEEELRCLTSGARADSRSLSRREAESDAQARKLAEQERMLEREARNRVDRYLLEARKQVEQVIADLSDGEGVGPVAIHHARRTVEDLLRTNRAGFDELKERGQVGGVPVPDPQPGDLVVSRSLGVTGRVAEVREDSVIVEAGGMKLSLAREDLTAPISEISTSRDSGARRFTSLPEIDARPEVDLRGLRVDEVKASLLAAVDAAVVADLHRLLVIHGKGTGALKKEVSRLVQEDLRIVSVRPGSFDEGGFGVTVLELKGDTI